MPLSRSWGKPADAPGLSAGVAHHALPRHAAAPSLPVRVLPRSAHGSALAATPGHESAMALIQSAHSIQLQVRMACRNQCRTHVGFIEPMAFMST